MDDEYYEIQTIEDTCESFDRLKKHIIQKVPVNFENWKYELLLEKSKIIIYKLDTKKGPARIPISLEIVQKEVLEVNIYAEDTKLDIDDINKMIGVNICQFTTQTIDKILSFFDEHVFIKGEQSQPKLLDEEEKHQNLALFFSNNADICRFCFTLEAKNDYTPDLQKAFAELSLLNTNHKKTPSKICDTCIKQLLQAHEARKNFILAEQLIQKTNKVIVFNSAGQSSSALQVPGTGQSEVFIALNSSDDSSSKEGRTRPAILQRPRKISKR